MGLGWRELKKGKLIVKQTVPFHSSEQRRKHCIGVPERRGKKFGHVREIKALEGSKAPNSTEEMSCSWSHFQAICKFAGEHKPVVPLLWLIVKGIPEVILLPVRERCSSLGLL